MYYLQSEASFDAAHFLKGYLGKCSNLHGHRWRIVATIQGETLQSGSSQRGMLLDFGDLKGDLRDLAEELDHALLLEAGALRPETEEALQKEGFRMVFFPFPTTAEHLAAFFYDRLREKGYVLRDVAVYETPTNCAIYSGGEEETWLV